IHRHDAAALAVGVAESRQVPHSLALRVDRLAPACWVLAPVGNKAPPQRVQRDLAGLMIATDDQQLLAGRSVPPWRIVVHAAIAHVHAIDDGIAKRPAALDDPPTHEGVYIVIRRSGANRAAQMVRGDHCERVEGLGASADTEDIRGTVVFSIIDPKSGLRSLIRDERCFGIVAGY